MQKAKRATPIKERAAKVGVALKPTPAGVRAVLADDGASPAARTRAKTALRAHHEWELSEESRAGRATGYRTASASAAAAAA